MFNKIVAAAAITVAMVTSVAQFAIAEDTTETKAFSLTTATDIYTAYMFRGFRVYDGTSIQPSVNAAYDTGEFGSFGGNVWAHFPGESDKQDQKFTEIDYTLSWSKTFEPVTFTAGYVWYTYPHDNTGTAVKTSEIFMSASLDTFLNPTFSFFQDDDAFTAQYYQLGFSHTIEWDCLGDGFNTTPYINFGFASNAKDVVYDDNGLEHITFGTSFDLKLGDIRVVPSLNYTRGIDDLTTSTFWAGVGFSYSL